MSPTTPNVPLYLGRYEVILPIAAGGMATVYLARVRGAAGFERDVALKLTHAHLLDNSEFVTGLLEEANIVVRIKHPNVVPVLDVVEDPQGVFLAMEYVEGDSLSGVLRRFRGTGTPLNPRYGLRILCDALQGLSAAHELTGDDGAPLGLVHRDFSPQNILVGLDGMARLTDFGIAKAASRLGETRTGVVKGKISFMSPEQIRAKGPVDSRVDVWAAGAVAWEVVAGRRLYVVDGDEVGVLFKIVEEPVPSLAEHAPHVPAGVIEVIHAALQKDPSHRIPTAAAFRSALLEACRTANYAIADHEGVAAVMREFVGPAMAERRQRAREIVATRPRGGSLIDIPRDSFVGPPPPPGGFIPAPPPSSPSSPSARSAQSSPLSISSPSAISSPSIVTPPSHSTRQPQILSIPPHGASIEATMLTDTSSVGDAPLPLPKQRLVIAAGITAVVTVGVTVGLISWLGSRSPDAQPNASSTAVAAQPLPAETQAAPDAPRVAPTHVPEPSVTASAAPSASAPPATTATVTAKPSSTSSPTAAPKKTASPLATTPYKTGGSAPK
jgi:serine/threonine-protein kinase